MRTSIIESYFKLPKGSLPNAKIHIFADIQIKTAFHYIKATPKNRPISKNESPSSLIFNIAYFRQNIAVASTHHISNFNRHALCLDYAYCLIRLHCLFNFLFQLTFIPVINIPFWSDYMNISKILHFSQQITLSLRPK